MSTEKATQRPWKIAGRNGIYTEDGQGRVATFQCPGSRHHGNRSWDDIYAEADANGQLIVEAVNAHDQVAQALRDSPHNFGGLETGQAVEALVAQDNLARQVVKGTERENRKLHNAHDRLQAEHEAGESLRLELLHLSNVRADGTSQWWQVDTAIDHVYQAFTLWRQARGEKVDD